MDGILRGVPVVVRLSAIGESPRNRCNQGEVNS